MFNASAVQIIINTDIMKKLFLLFIALMAFCCAFASNASLSAGSGAFDFKCQGAFGGITMKVDYYIPTDGDLSSMPIQFVMSGTDRNSDDYRDAWIERADLYKVIVLAPCFSADDFPSSMYQQGNVKKAYQNSDPSLMTYVLIDEIFLHFKELVSSSQSQYNIYGHSAGAQFVHRFVLFHQSPYLNRAVAANAGTYTFPTDEAKYQFGYSNIGGMAQWNVAQALAKELTLLIGENDTERDANLNVTEEADEQGLNRKERGLNFFQKWSLMAESLGIDYIWQLKSVEGVSHSNKRMSPVAADLLYGDSPQEIDAIEVGSASSALHKILFDGQIVIEHEGNKYRINGVKSDMK